MFLRKATSSLYGPKNDVSLSFSTMCNQTKRMRKQTKMDGKHSRQQHRLKFSIFWEKENQLHLFQATLRNPFCLSLLFTKHQKLRVVRATTIFCFDCENFVLHF